MAFARKRLWQVRRRCFLEGSKARQIFLILPQPWRRRIQLSLKGHETPYQGPQLVIERFDREHLGEAIDPFPPLITTLWGAIFHSRREIGA